MVRVQIRNQRLSQSFRLYMAMPSHKKVLFCVQPLGSFDIEEHFFVGGKSGKGSNGRKDCLISSSRKPEAIWRYCFQLHYKDKIIICPERLWLNSVYKGSILVSTIPQDKLLSGVYKSKCIKGIIKKAELQL